LLFPLNLLHFVHVLIHQEHQLIVTLGLVGAPSVLVGGGGGDGFGGGGGAGFGGAGCGGSFCVGDLISCFISCFNGVSGILGIILSLALKYDGCSLMFCCSIADIRVLL
jgi:hypothetical protein